MRVKLPKHGAVPIALLLEPSITLADLKVYTALSSFQGSNDDAYPSREAIVERCGCALETVSRAVSHLVELGWVQRVRRPNQSSIYRVMMETDEVSEVTKPSQPEVTAPSQPKHLGSDRPVTPEVTAPSLPSIKQKDHSKRPLSIADFALSYLNEKTGSRFSSHKGTGLTTIIKSGIDLERIRAVIDLKVKEWTGTDMAQYLTPSTLFRLSNFEKYENQLRLGPSKAKPRTNRIQMGFETFDPRREMPDEIPM